MIVGSEMLTLRQNREGSVLDTNNHRVTRRSTDGRCYLCGTRNAADILRDAAGLDLCDYHIRLRRDIVFRISDVPYRRLRDGRVVGVTR